MNRAILTTLRLAGLVLAVVVLVAWIALPVPLVLKILPAFVLAVTLIRPDAGLLVVAGIGPLGDVLSVWAQSPYPPSRVLEQLVLAVVVGTGLRIWRRPIPLRLAGPGALVAAIAIASAIAVQPALLLRQAPGASAVDYLRGLVAGGYFERNGPLDPIFFAALTAEGIALALVAERLVRDNADLAPRIVGLAVIGQAGLAVVTLSRLLVGALHTERVLRSLGHLFVESRLSSYADVNATASVLAMALIAGVGLVRDRAPGRWTITIALMLVAAGLWLTGSRSALLVLALAAIGWLAIEAIRRRGAARWIGAAGACVAIAAGAWSVAHYPSARNSTVAQAAATRAIMARVAVNMWRSAPALGVGIGRFYDESSAFGGEALRTLPFDSSNENAHNNFLQVLAEQGLVGFAALVAVIGVVIVPGAVARGSGHEWLRRSLVAAVVVFVVTWLAGHPLLVPEAALVFWLFVGVLAGLTDPPSGKWPAWLAAASVVLLVTAPVRADRTVRAADFEHIGVGLSLWQPAMDGVRYRSAGATFALYLPADGTAVVLPLRRADGAPDPVLLTLSVRGRAMTDVRVSGDDWNSVLIRVPDEHRRFDLVSFFVVGSGAGKSESPLVLIGKAEPQRP